MRKVLGKVLMPALMGISLFLMAWIRRCKVDREERDLEQRIRALPKQEVYIIVDVLTGKGGRTSLHIWSNLTEDDIRSIEGVHNAMELGKGLVTVDIDPRYNAVHVEDAIRLMAEIKEQSKIE